MTGYKKKIVALLITAALGSGALVVYPVQSAAVEPNKPLSDDFYSRSENGSDQSSNDLESEGWFLTMAKAVLLVVALGIAAIYLSKKFGARITNLPGKKIRVVETVYLGQRKALHLLEISGRQLLIGSTNESITKLTDITGAPKNNKERLGSPEALSEMDLSAAALDRD